MEPQEFITAGVSLGIFAPLVFVIRYLIKALESRDRQVAELTSQLLEIVKTTRQVVEVVKERSE